MMASLTDFKIGQLS